MSHRGISILPYLLGVIATGVIVVYSAYTFSRQMLNTEKESLSRQHTELIAAYISRYLVKTAIIGETLTSTQGRVNISIEAPPDILGESYWIEASTSGDRQIVKVYLDTRRDIQSEQPLFNLAAEDSEQWRFELGGELEKMTSPKFTTVTLSVKGGYIGFTR